MNRSGPSSASGSLPNRWTESLSRSPSVSKAAKEIAAPCCERNLIEINIKPAATPHS
jgi:hypothetical protein